MTALAEAITCYPPIIEDVALAIADDAYPNLSRMRYHGMLDEFARPLFEPMRILRGLDARLARMRAHLCDDLGFTGNRDDYYDPRNSFINEVLERRTGIPITLAVVWMAIGRRVGIAVEGIGFPGHFLVRVGGRRGIYVDVFNQGRTLEPRELQRLSARLELPLRQQRAALAAIDAKAMAERMLFNLRAIYAGRADHARAMLVCDRLFDLTADTMHRRDRGLHALELGAREVAVRDLEAYLATRPSADDAEHVKRLLRRAIRGTSTLN